ncbi:MAG: 3-ketoacyl-ACP reductase [Candidatus Binatia bacterium]|nr:MAG: 3-ketoacyl-ACP reductase [Candidatus Binatia bacterium]
MDFRGKVALVTGAAVGTGRAIACSLAREGCHVAVNYSRSQKEAEETAEEARKLGVRALAVQADVANEAAVRKMVEDVVAEFGHLEILVNNAGVTVFVPHHDLEALRDEDWDRIFGVNLKGAFYATRACVPHLKKAGGAILNVSSVAGVYATGSSLPYCASKAALNNMTVALARALAPEIRVNAVAPGFIDTRWWKEREGYEVVKKFAAERAPLRRVCQPEDVAHVALELLRSDVVTGQVVVVDAGLGIAV